MIQTAVTSHVRALQQTKSGARSAKCRRDYVHSSDYSDYSVNDISMKNKSKLSKRDEKKAANNVRVYVEELGDVCQANNVPGAATVSGEFYKNECVITVDLAEIIPSFSKYTLTNFMKD